MLLSVQQSLFDSVDLGMAKAVVNICDCFGNLSCQNNIQFRVRYPGSYAADRLTRKGDLTKLGTVSFNIDNGVLVINTYVCYDFTDQRSINDGALFDPTIFFACLYQIKDVLSDHGIDHIFISSSSFLKFAITDADILTLLEYVSKSLPYNLVVTV